MSSQAQPVRASIRAISRIVQDASSSSAAQSVRPSSADVVTIFTAK